MAIPKSPIFLLLLFTAAILLRGSAAKNLTEELVSKLLHLQYKSSDGGDAGVIQLNDSLLRHILSLPTPRPFSFLILFDPGWLNSVRDFQVLKFEFALASKSFLENNEVESYRDLFFFVVKHPHSVLHIRLVPGSAVDLVKDSVKVEIWDLSNLSAILAVIIENRTGLDVFPINPPLIYKNVEYLISSAPLLLYLAFYIVKGIPTLVVPGKILLHSKRAWMSGAILVYFFSVSGTMHSIVRKVPMFLKVRKDEGKRVFFYHDSGVQLGAEGLAVGFLYTVVGLLLALVTHFLVTVQSRNAQRIVMLVALFVSFWVVRKVIFLDNWKSGRLDTGST